MRSHKILEAVAEQTLLKHCHENQTIFSALGDWDWSYYLMIFEIFVCVSFPTEHPPYTHTHLLFAQGYFGKLQRKIYGRNFDVHIIYSSIIHDVISEKSHWSVNCLKWTSQWSRWLATPPTPREDSVDLAILIFMILFLISRTCSFLFYFIFFCFVNFLCHCACACVSFPFMISKTLFLW